MGRRLSQQRHIWICKYYANPDPTYFNINDPEIYFVQLPVENYILSPTTNNLPDIQVHPNEMSATSSMSSR